MGKIYEASGNFVYFLGTMYFKRYAYFALTAGLIVNTEVERAALRQSCPGVPEMPWIPACAEMTNQRVAF